jgi:hypothetical protein
MLPPQLSSSPRCSLAARDRLEQGEVVGVSDAQGAEAPAVIDDGASDSPDRGDGAPCALSSHGPARGLPS